MLSSFVALALSMIYLNHSCNAKNLPSISHENNGLVANSWRLLQNSEYKKDDLFCLSTGCVKTAASLINNLDQSVDPCDDFYQFACGNFIKNTVLNDGEMSRSIMSVINDVTINQRRMIVNEPIQPDELRPFKMMKLLFKSCMDLEKIEKIGLRPMKEMLKSLGGWPLLEAENWNESNFNWMDSLNGFKEIGRNMDFLIKLKITPDLKNHTKAAINLEQASFELSHQYLVKGTNYLVVDEYYKYMVDIAVLFGADRQRATEELKESLEFEVELAKISMPLEETNDLFKMYNPMNITDLQQKFPSIPWQEFLNKLLKQFIRQDDIIIVSSPKYFSGLGALLSKTPKRVQANYMMWRSVNDAVKYLTKELRQTKSTYKKRIFSIKEVPRWKECADISFELFKIAIGSMYVRRFSNENTKNNALEMVKVIKKELYKMLLSNEWMDDETRKNAMDKAKLILENDIAYPNELLDDGKLNSYYENLEVNDQDFYTSVLNLTKFSTDYEFSKLRKPVNKSDWVRNSGLVAEPNAFYIPEENSILFTAALLKGLSFSNDLPRYMIYSSIGSIIGHEITHGFDNSGRKFDLHGNLANWWAEETNKRFLEKEQCFIRQYGNYTINEGLKVNGTLTLGENIADRGGLKLAYNAYREWVKEHGVEPRLPGLQEYTPLQMFWLSNAHLSCSKDSMTYINVIRKYDGHSPSRFRVIGSFSNIKDFSDDFKCPLGSKMNPANKCQLW
ncbi:neprilysin-2-like [Metopolophium dirhodum]|uniref:neprilysin-2-like n=1 Tax=Metopolophium dirhodum TaxID=44670 RepID=UPI00298F9707|nr:neprilysin-2-like [Metopolophium dirhodum]